MSYSTHVPGNIAIAVIESLSKALNFCSHWLFGKDREDGDTYKNKHENVTTNRCYHRTSCILNKFFNVYFELSFKQKIYDCMLPLVWKWLYNDYIFLKFHTKCGKNK